MRRRNILCTGLLACLLGSAILSGCVYRPDVQQGNLITTSEVKSIKKGMTASQVKSKLGDPLLVNIYQNNRILYVYTFQHGNHRMKEKRLIIYLKNDRVIDHWYDEQAPGSHVDLPIR